MTGIPPNSLKDSNARSKMKTTKEEVRLCFISQHLGVRGACWNFKMGTKMNDKWVNYSYEPTQTKQQVG